MEKMDINELIGKIRGKEVRTDAPACKHDVDEYSEYSGGDYDEVPFDCDCCSHNDYDDYTEEDRYDGRDEHESNGFWLAFVDPCDPVFDDVEVDPDETLRLMPNKQFPMFDVISGYDGGEVCNLSCNDVLDMYTSDPSRIRFANEASRERFESVLTEMCERDDTINNTIKKVKTAGAVAASVGVLGAIAVAICKLRKHK